jgi:hypothetical protein
MKGAAMSHDRYLKAVLTVIALELLWIAAKGSAPAVSAQAQPAVTPVVIRGIQIPNGEAGYLPVAVLGSVRDVPAAAAPLVQMLQTEIAGPRPVRVEAPRPLPVEIDRPVTIETSEKRPLWVENVWYTATPMPR